MWHDFGSGNKETPREKCAIKNDGKYVMNYGEVRGQWSDCTNEDFKIYYQRVFHNSPTGFCLEEIEKPSTRANKLKTCVDKCSKDVCSPDVDVKNGCNQMYSCAQACKIRDLGMKEYQCKRECDRTGQSGCSPLVGYYQFDLCRDCNRRGCSNTWPTIRECEAGCSYYDE